jgi:hypothetical protein
VILHDSPVKIFMHIVDENFEKNTGIFEENIMRISLNS